MCQTCITNLNRAYTFKQQCEYAYKKLSNPSYSKSIGLRRYYPPRRRMPHQSSTNAAVPTRISANALPFRQEIILIRESREEDEPDVLKNTDDVAAEGESPVIKMKKDFLTELQFKPQTTTDLSENTKLSRQLPFEQRASSRTSMSVQDLNNAFTLPNIVRTYSNRQPSIVLPIQQVDVAVFKTSTKKNIAKTEAAVASPKERKKLPANFQCTKCLRYYVSPLNLRRHMEAHDTPKTPHQCTVCNRFFLNTFTLARHISNVHRQERPFVCDICGLTYKQDFALKTHINDKHTKKVMYTCAICGDVYTASQSLANHRRAKHPETAVSVRKRQKLNESNATAPKRKRSHPNRLKRKYRQYMYAKVYKQRNIERENALLRLKLAPLCCEYCGEMQPNSDALADHQYFHIDDGKRYKCAQCGHWTDRLGLHRLKHSELLRILQCRMCERKFRRRQQLKEHERTHTDDEAYKCHICGKSLANLTNLKLHLRMHTGERPYECAECGEKFISTVKRSKHGQKMGHKIKDG